ncbi:MAG: M23 family metallopeptidase [bacterium]|nr:M23 family metallopeptidase [bacterium]
MRLHTYHLVFAAAAAILFLPSSAGAHGYDPAPTWPLCGYDAIPTGTYTCTSTDPDLVNDTYGPRCMDSYNAECAGGEHDWHFGVDLHAEEDQMNVFASSCGKIKTLDENGGIENNKKVIIEHYRSWVTSYPTTACPSTIPTSFPSCSGANCYYTVYNHLSEIDSSLSTGGYIAKSAYLGLSGQNCDSDYPCSDKYEHVHFEVLDPTGGGIYTPGYNYSRWQREAVHPLRFLINASWDTDADNLDVSFVDVDDSDPENLQATISVSIDHTGIDDEDRELDLNRIEVRVWDNNSGALVAVTQPNEDFYPLPTPETISGSSVLYEVHPPFLDLELFTRQYSYADGSTYLQYTQFMSEEHHGDAAANHPYKSPFASQVLDGATNPVFDANLDQDDYEWGYHLHLAKSGSPELGEFNGVEMLSEPFNLSYSTYEMQIKLTELAGATCEEDLCLQARAEDAYGNVTDWVDHGFCEIPEATAGGTVTDLCNGSYEVSWTPSDQAADYRIYLADRPLTTGGDSVAFAPVPGDLPPATAVTTESQGTIAAPANWFVYVEACNNLGCSDLTFIGYTTVNIWCPPPAQDS